MSLAKVLDIPLGFVRPGGRLLALVKPQFEAGPDEVGKGGVVRDPAVHRRVCEQVAQWLEQRGGWIVDGLVESPIKGPEGNIEFLIGATISEDHTSELQSLITISYSVLCLRNTNNN